MGMSASRLIARWKRVLISAQCSGEPASSARSISATQAGERLEIGGGGALGGDARGDDLQAFEQREDLDDRGARDGRDGGADVRDAQHEPLGLEQPQRFAHGNDADLELPREIVDDQTRARRELAADDRFAQRRVDELLLRQVPGLRRGRAA